MRLLQYQIIFKPMRVSNVIFAILIITLMLQAHAKEMTPGEMRGIIRSADYPCARVLDMKSMVENEWRVQCNSGSFYVARDADGKFSVWSLPSSNN